MTEPALFFYRVGNFSYRYRLPVLPTVCTLLGRLLFSIYVPSSASIGRRVKLAYGAAGLVIHPRAVVEDDCLLSPGVVIGGRGGHLTAPRICAHAELYPGAKVLGPITVGAYARVGANAVLVDSLPAHGVAVAPKAVALRPDAHP